MDLVRSVVGASLVRQAAQSCLVHTAQVAQLAVLHVCVTNLGQAVKEDFYIGHTLATLDRSYKMDWKTVGSVPLPCMRT